MAHSLTAEEEEQFSAVIDEILEASDLTTISRKAISMGLETKIGRDLSDHKSAIKDLIIARFDAHSAAQATKRSASAGSEESRPKKKRKRDSSNEDEDAKLAAQLQEQENQRARTRSTRTGGSRSAVVKKRTPAKKKSAKKVRPEDDSDVDDGSDEPKKKRGGGGFQKPFNLSDELFDVCGEKQLSRPQVVKKLWEYIKANELQDPNDRKQIVCDEKLQAVFSIERTNAFSMNKFLGKHLYPIDE